MTDPVTYFLLGFLSSAALAAALATAYYCRVRRRVKSIVAYIERMQKAKEVVTPAIDKAFANKP